MKALVYTKDQCPFCVKAKTLLTIKGVAYTECKIGTDIVREDFVSLFPDQKTVPLIFIDNERIGTYDDLLNFFDATKSS